MKSADYNKFLKENTKKFSDALKAKDISAIFKLERKALEFDYKRASTEDMARNLLFILVDIKKMWDDAQDPNYIVKFYAKVEENIGPITDPILGGSLTDAIKYMRRKLGKIASHIASPAEKDFYKIRRKCLKLLNEQYLLLVNKHLGRDMPAHKKS